MKLFCAFDDCPNFIFVKAPLAPMAMYTCVIHTPLGADTTRFQEYQFDPDLDSGSDPLIDSGDDALPVSYSHRIGGPDPDENLHETGDAELNENE